MKNLVLILAIAISVASCKTEPKVEYALISGLIENPMTEVITIMKGREKVMEIVIKEDGTFVDTLNVSDGFYTFSHGREQTSFYVSAGYDLSVQLNTGEFDESISYSGIGSEANNYLASKYLSNETMLGESTDLYSLDEIEFKDKLLAIKNSNLEALSAAANIDKSFNSLETKNIDYEYYRTLSQYESAHAFYTKKEGFKASEDFLPEALKNLSFDNEDEYNQLPSYQRLAMSAIMDEVYANIGEDYQNANVEHFNVMDDIKIPALKNDIIKGSGSFLVSPGNPNMTELYEFFMSNLTDEEAKTKLTEKFNKNKDLVRGKPSPIFVDYENHKGGTTSLENLKGKFVYVDVWATWCGPCKREIPFLKEVEAQFHGKNIEFVSTSIDRATDHNKWVEMVKEKELGGMQLFADNDWNSKFIKDYAIEGIPRFILIDPEGNIITADAPRPSNPKLVELFKELKI